MSKWIIELGNKEYTISQNMRNWIVNGKEYSKKECLTFSKVKVFKEYKMPIPEAEVLIENSKGRWNIVVDGKYLNSGLSYHRLESIPIWSLMLFVLCLILMICEGLVSGLSILVSGFVILRICADKSYSVFKKFILIAVVIVAAIIIRVSLASLIFYLIM